MSKLDRYRIDPGSKVRLADRPTADDGGMQPEDGKAQHETLRERLIDLAELLYAEHQRSLLVVLQAMDTAGKDSTIRAVFSGLNPAGCRVTSFKAPAGDELAHNFLWRIQRALPPRGDIGVFNRSHYEDIIAVRVKGLRPEAVWRERYEHVNAFERLLHDEGTTVRKFYLHISKDYQRGRLQKRLDNPKKHWKFDAADLTERARWDEYMKAYESVLEKCSSKHAPWFVIPAEKRWYRDWLVTSILVETLEALKMKYPEPNFDPRTITIP
ncbi:MAG: polyphosphate kinase 2 family protein [Phycisphaerae bacterium]